MKTDNLYSMTICYVSNYNCAWNYFLMLFGSLNVRCQFPFHHHHHHLHHHRHHHRHSCLDLLLVASSQISRLPEKQKLSNSSISHARDNTSEIDRIVKNQKFPRAAISAVWTLDNLLLNGQPCQFENTIDRHTTFSHTRTYLFVVKQSTFFLFQQLFIYAR